ncbi:SMR family transporter [Labrenzia sp. DG1229]|uniref:SMR family transporter n=1 Tax=Labrenzia sp. DG1229 TaxID=681847 RepID=UPI00048E8924|nr:SMR family transporter [Labrenzia sp. DG1229]
MPASPIATYLFLGAAILAEVIATSALARTENFTRLVPSIITIAGYGLSFWLLSYPIRVLPTGVVYAIWSGAGIVLITMVAWLAFDQKLDLPAIVGLGLIIAGVVIINVFSKSVAH